MVDIGTLVMKVTADTDQAEKQLNGFGNLVGKIGGIATIGFAAVGTAIGLAVVDGVKGISAMEDATAQLNAVLTSTGGAAGVTAEQATKLAESYQLTTKFAAESVLASENLLLTFTNIGKDVFPAATQATLDMATAMGTDASSQAIALGKALNDPEKGITALTRVGVTFTEGQKKSIKAMQGHGDMAGAQSIILQELQKEFGGSAEAAGVTFAGKMEIAKNSIGEVYEGLATTLMPSLMKLLDWINSNMSTIQAVFETVFNAISEVIKVVFDFIKVNLVPVFKEIFNYIKDNWPTIQATFKVVFDAISAVVVTVYDIIKDKLIPIIQKIWEIVAPLLPLVGAAFKIAFDIAIAVINAVLAVIDALLTVIKALAGTIKKGLDAVKAVFETVFGAIKSVIDTVQKALNAFNSTPAQNKTATITTKYETSGTPPSNPSSAFRQRAFGGPVQAGESYLVGERGREIFTPSTGGTISTSTGSKIVINVNGAGDPNAVAQAMVRTLRQQGVALD